MEVKQLTPSEKATELIKQSNPISRVNLILEAFARTNQDIKTMVYWAEIKSEIITYLTTRN